MEASTRPPLRYNARPLEIAYKTPPFLHQSAELQERGTRAAGLVPWDQGTGKTKLILDEAAGLYGAGEIDALLVVAPSGVHTNWVVDEVPLHLSDAVPRQALLYQSGKRETKTFQRAFADLLTFQGLSILAVNYEAYNSKKAKTLIWKFLQKRKCLYVLDEAQWIKTPSAKRTKAVASSGKYAPYRRAMSGTLVAESPFNCYTPVKFLVPDFWDQIGCGTYAAFKNQFGVWQSGLNHNTGQAYNTLVAYKNLPQLNAMLATLGKRVTKEEVLDLPPKLFTKRYFDLSPEQARAYTTLRDEYMVELDSGGLVTAALAIVRLLRLQQITCNYLPKEDGEDVLVPLSDTNPRLKLLEETISEFDHKAIIWARFTEDIDQIMSLLGNAAVRYDGQISPQECEDNKQCFQKGSARFFVGNPAKGSEGLTLHAARTVIYYSNMFSLTKRLQSEDRAHRIGQEHPVNYVDLIAQGTVDEHIVKSLRLKYDVMSKLNGDRLREWI